MVPWVAPEQLRRWERGSMEKTDLKFVPQEFVDNFFLLIGCFVTELGEKPDPTILILSLQ